MALSKHLAGAAAFVVGAAVALAGGAMPAQADKEPAQADREPARAESAPAESAQAAKEPTRADRQRKPGSAFGLAAEGPLAIKPLPAVESDGSAVSKSLLPPTNNGLIDVSALTVRADRRNAEARATGVSALQQQITASAISAKCVGDKGVANLANAKVAGREIDSSPAPNTTVPINIAPYGEGSVTFNKQYRTPDGRLSVTGMAVELPLPEGKKQTLDVSSVTCGERKKRKVREDYDDSSIRGKKKVEDARGEKVEDVSTAVEEERAVPEAPVPAPVDATLPVTG